METHSEHEEYKTQVSQALQQCADFLCTYLPLANVHPTDFIVTDVWERLVPRNVQEQLLSLNHHDLCLLPMNHNNIHQLISDATQSLKVPDSTCNPKTPKQTAISQPDQQIDAVTKVHSKDFQWRHHSLGDFLSAVQEHRLENLSCVGGRLDKFAQWLQGTSQDGAVPFVHAFMTAKKQHEVEVMADICTRLFHKMDADVVVDIGSGKGYLSTHLSLQSGLPVVAIDSQPGNTSGAQWRTNKLSKQWPALVKQEKQKELEMMPERTLENGDSDSVRGEYSGKGGVTINAGADSKLLAMAASKGGNQKEVQTACSTVDRKVHFSSSDKPDKTEGQTSGIAPEQNVNGDDLKEKTVKHSSHCDKSKPNCAAVTMFVSPQTDLTRLIQQEVHSLCPLKRGTEDLQLLLTGLHTCGGLGASMVKLFVTDRAVRGLCGVGCCYHLMQERFAGAAELELEVEETDFPLSSVLTQRQMKIGSTALNLASLALPRMTSSEGQLQGETFYPRALLQAVLKQRLGGVPDDLKSLRGLARKASSPCDYVMKALAKLNIAGCQLTEVEVMEFHQQHSHQQEKMAAFFQLRAALAPVVEAAVLLDRLMYLLEQDSVKEAFLVRLFDPVTSPRCHAIIATKS